MIVSYSATYILYSQIITNTIFIHTRIADMTHRISHMCIMTDLSCCIVNFLYRYIAVDAMSHIHINTGVRNKNPDINTSRYPHCASDSNKLPPTTQLTLLPIDPLLGQIPLTASKNMTPIKTHKIDHHSTMADQVWGLSVINVDDRFFIVALDDGTNQATNAIPIIICMISRPMILNNKKFNKYIFMFCCFTYC